MAILKKKKVATATAGVKDYGVVIAPLITEKSSMVKGTNNTLVFRVQPDATKTEIKDAIQKIFDVKVKGVRTCNYLGKEKRFGRFVGRKASFKKAYVTLEEGQTISIVEGL